MVYERGRELGRLPPLAAGAVIGIPLPDFLRDGFARFT